eukprot:GDKJ01056966.1.p1 GENE.GDKJ01056966.1~~GDKJ01056966.1.p1  ORF type:complete len:182 (+),score=93.92 GDKJ01056966.1:2-547(+)
MERIMKAQAFADPAQLKMLTSSRVLEINPDHALIQKLLAEVNAAVEKANAEPAAEGAEKKEVKPEDVKLSDEATRSAKFLFDAALIGAGFDLQSPTEFAANLYKVLGRNLDVEGDGIQAFDISGVTDEEDAPAAPGEEDFNFDDFNFDDMAANMGAGEEGTPVAAAGEETAIPSEKKRDEL